MNLGNFARRESYNTFAVLFMFFYDVGIAFCDLYFFKPSPNLTQS